MVNEAEALFRWAEHPRMAPRPESYFVGYWTTMPRPIPERQARASFKRFVRGGELIQVHLTEDRVLRMVCAYPARIQPWRSPQARIGNRVEAESVNTSVKL